MLRRVLGARPDAHCVRKNKNNYRGPSTSPLRGFAQDDGDLDRGDEAFEPGLGDVVEDGAFDLKGKGEGVAAILAGDARDAAGAHAFQKRFYFEGERLFELDGQLAECEAGRWVRAIVRGGERCELPRGQVGCGDVDEEGLLMREVDGEVLARLEEAHLAHALGADAAGGEIGDASVGEGEADVGDVRLVREDGQADSADLAQGRAHQAEDDVEIVDHEVEDHVDVKRARGEDAEAVHLKEHGLADVGQHGGDGRVEAFEMADLQDAAIGVGDLDESVSVFERRCDGLLDEHVDTGGEQFATDAGMVHGGHADRSGGDAERS